MDDDFAFQLEQEREEQQKVETVPKYDEQIASSSSSENAQYSTTYVDPQDGIAYEWDFERRAWFPKIDENFIATYQAGYGDHKLNLTQPNLQLDDDGHGNDDAAAQQNHDHDVAAQSMGRSRTYKERIQNEYAGMTKDEIKQAEKEIKKEKKKLAAEREKKKKWFDIDEEHNTNVYVSNLPLDLLDEEFEKLMSKCGLIARDFDGKKPRIKMYRDEEGNLKGDGRCCYVKKESVDLALKILDGSLLKNNRIKVEMAHFELKGDFDPTKRRKVTPQMKKRMKAEEQKLLSWKPEKLRGLRPKSDNTVVIQNAFTIQEFNENPVRLFDLQEALMAKCSAFGDVKKLKVCDNNPDGIVLVTYNEPEEADDCITMMNYRIFEQRQLRASRWDGKTKYVMAEKQEDKAQRLEQWDKYLEQNNIE